MPGKRHSGSDLVEHDDLVGELPLVEKMSTAERLKHAKKRRQHQLKKFSQYEKQVRWVYKLIKNNVVIKYLMIKD